MPSNSRKETNLFEIIDRNELRGYILGSNIGETQPVRVIDDYARWDNLIEFYRQLPDDSRYRNGIDSEIKSLILDDSEVAVGAGVILARLIDLGSSQEAIEAMIHDGRYLNLPESTKKLVLQTIAHFRLNSQCSFLMEEILKKELLLSYLITWSSRPPYVSQIGTDDLWRIQCLAEFYEHEDRIEYRKFVETQIALDHPGRAKLIHICQTFIEKSGDEFPAFREYLQRVIADS